MPRPNSHVSHVSQYSRPLLTYLSFLSPDVGGEFGNGETINTVKPDSLGIILGLQDLVDANSC